MFIRLPDVGTLCCCKRQVVWAAGNSYVWDDAQHGLRFGGARSSEVACDCSYGLRADRGVCSVTLVQSAGGQGQQALTRPGFLQAHTDTLLLLVLLCRSCTPSLACSLTHSPTHTVTQCNSCFTVARWPTSSQATTPLGAGFLISQSARAGKALARCRSVLGPSSVGRRWFDSCQIQGHQAPDPPARSHPSRSAAEQDPGANSVTSASARTTRRTRPHRAAFCLRDDSTRLPRATCLPQSATGHARCETDARGIPEPAQPKCRDGAARCRSRRCSSAPAPASSAQISLLRLQLAADESGSPPDRTRARAGMIGRASVQVRQSQAARQAHMRPPLVRRARSRVCEARFDVDVASDGRNSARDGLCTARRPLCAQSALPALQITQ